MRGRGLAFCFVTAVTGAAAAPLASTVGIVAVFMLFTPLARAEAVARFPDASGAVSTPSAPSAPAPPSSPSAPARPAPPQPAGEPGATAAPELVPGVEAPRGGSDLLSERAARQVAEGRITQAISAYSEAIRLDPRNGRALLALGKLRAGLGELGEAELLFSTAARIRSVASEALAERARLRRSEGRDAEAVSDLEIAVGLAPDDTARAEELALWHVAHRAWLPALAVWRRAAAIGGGGSDSDAQARRARVQARALGVLAADLDVVHAGATRDRSWTRRALARIERARGP